jgi:hypothetical protein
MPAPLRLSVRAANTDTQIATARRTVSPAAVLGNALRLFARIMVMSVYLPDSVR